ncbi:MAG: amino acid ABC transporter permease [Anaerolineales bacterium]|jgi:polar amino acid transport system permease protein
MDSTSKASRPTRAMWTSVDISQVPWWALILIAGVLLIIYLILTSANYLDTFLYLKDGVIVTARITIFSYLIAVVLGLLAGIGRTSKNVMLYTISTLYVEIIRGIPMIVLILYVAFAVVPLGVDLINLLGKWAQSLAPSGFLAGMATGLVNFSIREVSFELRAILALGLGYGAYEAEVFRAGIQSISRGQIEASLSLGLSYFQTLRFIILPQAVRRVLPPLGNDFVSLLKDSSLATVLAVNELTQLGRKRRSSTFRVFETFNVLVFLYLAMTLVLSAGVGYIERRFKVEE